MPPPKIIYKCESCPKVFESKKDLLVHQYNHKEKPYTTCDTCNKVLPNELMLKRHMKVRHRRTYSKGLNLQSNKNSKNLS